jgi:hypothetical protein
MDGPGAWSLVNRFSTGRATANRFAEHRPTDSQVSHVTYPADFLTCKRLPTGPDLAPSTGYADPESSLELVSLNGSPPSSQPSSGQVFVHCGHAGLDALSVLRESFTQALAFAVDNDSVLGPLAAAARPLAGGLVDSRGQAVTRVDVPSHLVNSLSAAVVALSEAESKRRS